MKAFVCPRYGGPEVLELAELPTPEPADNEVLIRIHATTVTSGDWRVRTMSVPRGLGPVARLALGFQGPRQPILGTELAGVVERVGAAVTRFQPGDEVFAFPGGKMGCHAEYRTLPEDGPIAPKPAALSFEEAASLCFGGTTALHFLRKARLEPGNRVLVIGASGGVGAALVQLATHGGAEVTGVTSARNYNLVASLGTHRVIDYTRQDWTASTERFDIIADTVGTATLAMCRPLLAEKGKVLAIAADLPRMLEGLWAPLSGAHRVIAGPAQERAEDIPRIGELATIGALQPVIDREYAFDEIPQAHAYVETRRKRGSVVVRVCDHPS